MKQLAISKTLSLPTDAAREEELKLRLKSKVLVDENGCWIWQGAKSQGYGKISINDHPLWSHRLSFTLFNGDISDGLFVCHKCDVPACINPEHLFLGTQKENIDDMISKGRDSKPPVHFGLSNANATLTDDQVAAIRADPRVQRVIASEYGCSQSTIWRLRHHKTRATI